MPLMMLRPTTFPWARFCASSGPSHENDGHVAAAAGAPSADALSNLHDEIAMLTDAPLAIGTLFKTLSPESRAFLNKEKMPLETFLLRHPAKYSVFKPAKNPLIMVSRFGSAPESAQHAVERTTDQLFDGRPQAANSANQSATSRIYTVLKYIPNEWVDYSALNIPADVKKSCIGKPAKKFFDKHPRYFEVRFDSHRAHTFEIRRSLALQQYMAAQEAQNRTK
jgi:hypothetical protein